MNDGVLYEMLGHRHDEHFVVSLMSLRDHWDGAVVVVVDESARELAEAADRDLGPLIITTIDMAELETIARRNKHYLAKTTLNRYSPFDRTVFLDLDTLVVGDFSAVFPLADEWVLTQFAGWTTTGGPMMMGRVRQFAEICPIESARMLADPHPAINTGVFGWSGKAERIFDDWFATTRRKVVFMADELAAQQIYVRYPHRVLDDRWNCSPLHSTPKSIAEAVIFHGHGFKFIKCQRGREIWMPRYEEAKRRNVAGIANWEPRMKALRGFLGGINVA